MPPTGEIPSWKDKILFTPGPLTTSRTVKQAMLRDLGSRDYEFIELVRWVRGQLLEIGEVAEAGYEAIPMQGSGTFGIEAVLGTATPPDGKWLVVINGAYGKRMAAIAEVLGMPVARLEYREDQLPVAAEVDAALADDPDITHVGIIHCETSTGMFNPVEAIGEVVQRRGKAYFVDAMSSFGAVPLDLAAAHVDWLVSSANKCIEGVPGFSFVLARRKTLEAAKGQARSVSLDLHAQWAGLEANGQFRFTPPTHALLAFGQALAELAAEGGVAGRAARYRGNYEIVAAGMKALGFREFLVPEARGYIITSFWYPKHPKFDFRRFYDLLNERDIAIYPGKVSHADTFRIGHIGRIFPADCKHLLAAVEQVVREMGFQP